MSRGDLPVTPEDHAELRAFELGKACAYDEVIEALDAAGLSAMATKVRQWRALYPATPTGRAPSQPALQNIRPYSTETGDKIREALRDEQPAVTADFAVIETRVLARAPRATTDQDGQTIEVLILSERVSSTGLVRVCAFGAPPIARHRDRLNPLNDAARALLGKS